MRTWIASATLVLGVVLAACQSITFNSQQLSAVQDELNRQYALWQGQAIHSYDYTFSRTCPCPTYLQRPVVVSVVDSAVVAVMYLDDSTAAPDSTFQSYFTVEGIFGQIQIALNLRSDSIYTEYDPALHYPIKVMIDQNWLQNGDELGLFAQDLKPKP